jgi:carboxypeptidase C (cathepsin A)
MGLGGNARAIALGLTAIVVVLAVTAIIAVAGTSPPEKPLVAAAGKFFKPEESVSNGSVTIDGRIITYQAVAGTLVVHPKGWDDVKQPEEEKKDKEKAEEAKSENPTAEASMFYVAYFKRDVPSQSRPITFLFNGGPGSSTVWLHMGAFGPRRVITLDDSHTPAAPYSLINNGMSLLDASDLVFIDAPGTGFSRIAGGKDKEEREKAFLGMDADAYAFSEFIAEFLSRWQRWNSPKYLFGESYGTPRSSIVVNQLETDRDIDFNGVILLSQILNFDLSPDGPENNPGVDLPYELALPTYAASAWYHKKLAGPPGDLAAFVHDVERFAMNDYAQALEAGAGLSDARRNSIAQKLHQYTGLPISYILKANLRIDGGEFEKNLQDERGLTTGRLDTRFSGPTMDPLSKEADYDPQAASISSAYVSAFNDYVRSQLKYGQDKTYKPEVSFFRSWNFQHQPPGAEEPIQGSPNVMPDIASAMKYNPQLRIQVNGGYFDLATPYYEGWYEMHHLPIPKSLQNNIEYRYYASGHMVYAHEQSLKELHDNVADFIRRTDNVK